MRVAVAGPASEAVVWDRFTRPPLWSTWAPHIRGVDCDDERIRPGSVGTVRGVGPLRVRFVVTDVDDAARRWTWTFGGLVRMEHGVESDPTGTSAWVRMAAPLAVPYLPLLRMALRRLTA